MRKLNYNNNKISRNEWTFCQRITPNLSNSSDITPSYFPNSSLKNNNKSLRKNILKCEECKTNYIKNKKDIINFSSDKIVVGNTINNNDIKFAFETSNNSYLNNFQSIKSNIDSNKILNNYIIRLKNFGFPEIGEIYLSKDIYEQEKTFNFFEYLINTEANNLEINNIKEKETKEQIKKMSILKEELTAKTNQILELNKRIQKQKKYYEHQLNKFTKDNENLKSLNNKISLKNKNLDSRLHSLNKSIKKFESMKSNIINAVEVIDNVQNKDMEKMFNRVKNTEILLESLKEEYNESLKELSFQVSSFRNFIYEIHDEICILLEKPYIIENNVYNLDFSEFVNYLKNVFKKNFKLLKERIYFGDSGDYISSQT